MSDKEILKKQIIYRSIHRGTKEMDLLLGNFVEKNINSFNLNELQELLSIINTEDTILEKWYFNKISIKQIPVNKVSKLLKIFKI
jgi:antitoxin CptB